MAPKDELHRQDHHQQLSLLATSGDLHANQRHPPRRSNDNDNDNDNDNHDDNEGQYENGYFSDENEGVDWKRKFLQRIKEFWKDDEFLSLKTKCTVAATAILVLTATGAAYQRRRSGQRRRQVTNHPNAHTPNDNVPASLSSLVPTPQRRRSHSSLLWLLCNSLLRSKDDDSSSTRRKVVNVSLSMLQLAARQGLVKKALVGSGEILYQDRENGGGNTTGTTAWKRTQLPSNSPGIQSDLLELLSRHGCEDVSALPESLSSRLAGPLLAALPFVYLALVYKIFKNIHGGGNEMKLLSMNDTTTTRFSDVAGLEPIMPEVTEVVYYLRQSQNYHALGAKPPRGILFYGPPGAGKTLLARAVAGEANAAFCACSGSDFCEMYVGRGAARVRNLFERARSQALQRSGQSWWKRMSSSWTKSPSQVSTPPPPTAIIFIDEFDALAKSRSYGGLNGNDERESTLNQLLTEMDGFASSNNDNVTIILIAATNRPDVLDPAILRRFDRQIHVSYPSADGRRDIFQVHARQTNCRLDAIDWSLLASDEWTANFSGSDLRNVVNDAALLAVRERSAQVQQSHLERAIQRAQSAKSRADLAGNRSGRHFLYVPPNS